MVAVDIKILHLLVDFVPFGALSFKDIFLGLIRDVTGLLRKDLVIVERINERLRFKLGWRGLIIGNLRLRDRLRLVQHTNHLQVLVVDFDFILLL